MRETWSRLGFLLTLLHLSYQVAARIQSNYYTAAVVEYAPIVVDYDSTATMMANTKQYIELMEEAKRQNVDIIVFPEYGLTSALISTKYENMSLWTSVIPSAETKSIPCMENLLGMSQILMALSCAARANEIYVVVNMAEKVICESASDNACPSNGTYYFNTNVVFDRKGTIIARYRKTHLIMEEFNVTKTPEIVTFDTDFGVKFGTFICFDIMYPIPSLNLTRMEGVTNIVYPNAWNNEVPLLTSAQVQYSWAYSENVNFLAAGYSLPEESVWGTGIYLGRRGIAKAVLTRNSETRMFVSRVPKTDVRRPQKQTIQFFSNDTPESYYKAQQDFVMTNGLATMRDNFSMYETVPVNGFLAERICHRGFCCNFEIRTSTNDNSTKYRAVVYNGGRLFPGGIKAGIRVCAVVQCTNDSPVSCTSVNRSNTTFVDLNIMAPFDYSQFLVMPDSLNSSMLPIEQFYFKEDKRNDRMIAMLSLSQPTKNLVEFGIYARDYRQD